ncbi:ATP-binding protein [Algiphilus sp. W345]|uniref:histidine kinase n=1 Tax=Banduia mediterranea TaxID=3075609 RepID=A0ABU2WLY0_9GAMM|nr:ATP-binding protein [Algiphilus sp. W345]MDT0498219.1 ATP-binding protein [Algiphilus sp. W345]
MEMPVQSTALRSGACTLNPAPRASVADVDADAVVQALHLAAAIFDDSGRLLSHNAAFASDFTPPPELTRRAFESRFQPFADVDLPHEAGTDEVYCPSTGRSYSLAWSNLGHGLRLLTALDLSDRVEWVRRHRALQDQLLFTSRAMSVGEMATTLAHELNQPLATIINYLGAGQRLIEKLPGLPPRLNEALDMARSQAEHAAAVIARVREFVRTREPRRDIHHVGEFASHVVQLLQLEAQKHRVLLRVEIADSLPEVRVDRVMIEQVLANLVKNGIEAMRTTPPDERIVRVGARLNADGRVQIRVSDRGCGLADTTVQQLFAPFFTTKSNGMGVGLAICRSIVEFHEGNLYFEDNPEGGASFVFTLPAASQEAEQP